MSIMAICEIGGMCMSPYQERRATSMSSRRIANKDTLRSKRLSARVAEIQSLALRLKWRTFGSPP